MMRCANPSIIAVLTDTGLTNENRIIFGATLQNLYRATYFFIPTDDRIQLSLLRQIGQILGVFFQRIAHFFVVLSVPLFYPVFATR